MVNSLQVQAKILLIAPQPFYEDRGTPIVVRYVLDALSELGYQVDVLTLPVGDNIDIPGVRIMRTNNPFGFRKIPIGVSLKKLFLDVLLFQMLHKQLRRERYTFVYAVEEAVFLAAILCSGRMFLVYDMHSCLSEQLKQHIIFRSRLAQAACRRFER